MTLFQTGPTYDKYLNVFYARLPALMILTEIRAHYYTKLFYFLYTVFHWKYMGYIDFILLLMCLCIQLHNKDLTQFTCNHIQAASKGIDQTFSMILY